ARSRALADAKIAEGEARKRAESDASRRVQEEERLARERDAAEKRKAEEEARKAADEDMRRRAEQEATRRLEKKETDEKAAQKVAAPAAPTGRRREQTEEDEDSPKKGKAAVKTPAAKKGAPVRRTGKLTIARALSDDDERVRSVASFRRQLNRAHR